AGHLAARRLSFQLSEPAGRDVAIDLLELQAEMRRRGVAPGGTRRVDRPACSRIIERGASETSDSAGGYPGPHFSAAAASDRRRLYRAILSKSARSCSRDDRAHCRSPPCRRGTLTRYG